MAHSPVILCQIHPGWLELPLARTIFHGPKPVCAIEVLLYMYVMGNEFNSKNDKLILKKRVAKISDKLRNSVLHSKL